MSKRVISIILSCLLILTCLPINSLPVLADEGDEILAATDDETVPAVQDESALPTEGDKAEAADAVDEAETAGSANEADAAETIDAANETEAADGPDPASDDALSEPFAEDGEETDDNAAVLNTDYDPNDFSIRFDFKGGDNVIFNDETQELDLEIRMPEDIAEKYMEDAEDVQDLGVFLNAGVHGGDDWIIKLKKEDYAIYMPMSDEWPVLNGVMKITLHGDKIYELVKEYGWFNIWAGIGVGTTGSWDWLCEDFADFDVRESRAEYDFEKDWQMLEGWERDVHHKYHIWIENKDIPDGRDEEYEVTDVAIESETPEEEGRRVLNLRKETDGNDEPFWKFRALNNGTAVVKVSYKDLDGSAKSYTFNVKVADDVYYLNIDTDSGRHVYLPDESAYLVYDIEHYSNNPEREGKTDGLHVAWAISDEAKDVFDLTPTDNGAKVTFDLPADKGFGFGIVMAFLSDGSGEVASGETRLITSRAFSQILPYRINSEMNVGDKETITFEERIFAEDLTTPDRSRQAENVHFRWYYDPNAVRILDANGQQVGNEDESGNYIDSPASTGTKCDFTIERLKEWDTEISLDTEWVEDGENYYDNTRFHLNDKNYDAWFEMENDHLYNDGTATVLLNLENYKDVNYSIGVFDIGFWDGDPGAGGKFIDVSEFCTTKNVDRGIEVTLDGKKIWEKAQAYGVYEIWLHADIETKDSHIWLGNADQNMWLREAREDYFDREYDRSMLLHWTGMVFPFYRVYCENAENPDGFETDYQVTNVRIVRQDPWEAGKKVVTLSKTDEGGDRYWWNFEATAYGAAEFEVTYNDIHGQKQSYRFRVFVSRDVYFVDVRSEDGSTRSLPGGQKTLIAEASHISEDDPSTEGITYEWILPDNGPDCAELIPDKKDPSKAVVKFREKREDEDWIWEDFRAECIIYDGVEEETGEKIERSRGSINLVLADEYYEIRPCEINSQLPMGETEEIKPEVRSYSSDQDDYEIMDIENYRWYYDERMIEILDENGNKVGNEDAEGNYNDSEASHGNGRRFTIRRLDNAPTDITLSIDFVNRYGDRQWEENRYHFDDVEYVDPSPAVPEDPLRIYGGSRFETAYAIADKLKEVLGVDQFDGAVLSTGAKFPDALAGGYLANIHNVPILLISDARKAEVEKYIKKNVKAGKTIYVLGGANTVSDACLAGLKKDYKIKRLAGNDRYLTNLEILKEVDVKPGQPVLVATGKNYADALSASAVPMPILLVGSKLTPDQTKYLDGLKGSEFFILGAEAAVSKDVENGLKKYGKVRRIAGSNRYATSVEVAKFFYQFPSGISVTYGQNFPDGLCGGVLACRLGCPLILANNPATAYTPGAAYAKENKLSSGLIYGSSSLITDDTALKMFFGAKRVTEYTHKD